MKRQVNLGSYIKKVPIVVDIPNSANEITLKKHMLVSRNAEHDISPEPYFIKP